MNGGNQDGSDADGINFALPRFKASYASESEPHTPIDQMPMPGSINYENLHRFGSVSSIATTDDDDFAAEIQYPWTPQQDEIVRLSYDEYVSKPQTTPFSGRYPPSGALHRVAKNTLKLAKHEQIPFPHSMNAVRQRILTLCANDAPPESQEELEKYQVQDYFSMVPRPRQLSIDNDEFEFSDAMSSSRRLSVEEKYSGRTPKGGAATSNPALGSAFMPSLSAPFKEPKPTLPAVNTTMGSTTLTEEDVVNIVAKRKRDSLRMKRGQF